MSVGAAIGRRGPARRRGLLLLAVLVVMATALLAAGVLLALAQSATAGAATHERGAQARALAWSGVQAVGETLDGQRDRVLSGERPRIDGQLVVYENGDRLGVVRLLPWDDGETLRAEAGRLDLNHADADAIAATGLVDPAMAASIVEARSRRGGFLSESELLSIPELPTGPLVGSPERLVWSGDLPDDGLRARAGTLERAGSIGLLDVATVHAVEPLLRRDGSPRWSLAEGWSPELEAEVTDAFGAEVAVGAKALADAGIDGDARIVAALRARALPPADWPDLLDAFTAHPGPWLVGRLDINSASFEALRSLPGLSPEQCAEIVRVRDDLGPTERWTPVWPLLRGVLEPAQFESIADRVTTRCFTWRVRLAAGEVAADDPDGPIQGATLWEAVIDLSAPRWRVASLRDATLMPLAVAMLAGDDAAPDAPPADDAIEDAEPSADDAAPFDERSMPEATMPQPAPIPAAEAPRRDPLPPREAPRRDPPRPAELRAPDAPRAAERPRADPPRRGTLDAAEAPRRGDAPGGAVGRPRPRGEDGARGRGDGGDEARPRGDQGGGAGGAPRGTPPAPGRPVGRWRTRRRA